jgi:hypothetical protein
MVIKYQTSICLLFGAIVTISCHRRVKRTDVKSDEITSKQTANQGTPQPLTDSVWRASTCSSPCCGGSVCKVAPENASSRGLCREGSMFCNKCASGLTCIPGVCSSQLAPDTVWNLAISYVGGPGIADVCSSPWTNAAVCVKPTTASDWNCLKISDSCSHDSHSQGATAVTTSDLTSTGIDIEVRANGIHGTIIASRQNAKYPNGITTAAICSGLRFEGLTSSIGVPLKFVVFFLDPRIP